MQGLFQTQTAYDRALPDDLRTDAEIENDAAERAREKRQAAERAALFARIAARNAMTQPTPKHSADGEQKTSD